MDPLQQRLLDHLSRLPAATGFLVAFSGGLDSSVLLHACAALRGRLGVSLRALHADHRLQPQSPEWSRRCLAACAALGVECRLATLDVRGSGHGLEAAARAARYRALADALGPGEVLLTAQHQDDQAETLLVQLMRGGAAHGLAAMPACRPFAAGHHARPLLGTARAELLAYAGRHGLGWIDDPSNFDTGFERNFVRHELLPAMARRRPGIARVLARSAGHLAEQAHLLDELAAGDLTAAAGPLPATLAIPALAGLSAARVRNLLRHWLRTLGLAVPDSHHTERLLREVIAAAPAAEPLVTWPGAEVRRYRDLLYALPPLPPPPDPHALAWDGPAPLGLADGGSLAWEPGHPGLAAAALRPGRVTVRRRLGGERVRLTPGGRERSLKNLLQERGVPPWLRPYLPLLHIDGQVAYVPLVGPCLPFAAAAGESSLRPVWLPPSALRGVVAMRAQNHEN